MLHFFPDLLPRAFCFRIFFWSWANLVAGFRKRWRSFLDMAALPFSHSTEPGPEAVE